MNQAHDPLRTSPPPDVLAPSLVGLPHETWNRCPSCGRNWKDAVATPGVLHRTTLCYGCDE